MKSVADLFAFRRVNGSKQLQLSRNGLECLWGEQSLRRSGILSAMYSVRRTLTVETHTHAPQ